MRYSVIFVLLISVFSAVWADECKTSSQKVLVNLALSSVSGRNDFAGVDTGGVSVPNTISYVAVEGNISKNGICIKARELTKDAALSLFKTSSSKMPFNNNVPVYFAPRTDIFISLDDTGSRLKLDWQVDLLASDGLLEKIAPDDNYLPACVIQHLQFYSTDIAELNGNQYWLTTNAETLPLKNCQGSKTLYDENHWSAAKAGNKDAWLLALSFLIVPENAEPEKTFSEKTKEFFDTHPVSEDAKRRFDRR